jgi:hypothetical protein
MVMEIGFPQKFENLFLLLFCAFCCASIFDYSCKGHPLLLRQFFSGEQSNIAHDLVARFTTHRSPTRDQFRKWTEVVKAGVSYIYIVLRYTFEVPASASIGYSLSL